MKKLFITLSFFFVAAYANNSMSGYTESIVENANEADEKSTSLRPQRANTPSSSSSTNYEGTFETPHNPFSGKIKDYTWKNEIPRFTKSSSHKYGFDQFPEECYKSIRTTAYCYKYTSEMCKSSTDTTKTEECKLLKEECPKYTYCYERIPQRCNSSNPPKECNDLIKDSDLQIVYISVKKDEDLSFKFNLSKNTYDNYCLIREDYVKDDKGNYKMQKNGTEIKKTPIYMKPFNGKNGVHPIEKKYLQTEGIFKVYANTGDKALNGKVCVKPKPNQEYIAAIKVIPYDEIPKKFIYLQMDGGEESIESNALEYPYAYTKSKVDEYVNKVFSQAVIKATSLDGNAALEGKKDFHKKLIEVELTNIDQTSQEYLDKLDEIYNFFKISSSLDINSEAWHVVIAINKERKKWHLGKCKKKGDTKIDLNACPYFEPEQEHPHTLYYIKSSENCRKGLNPKDSISVTIRSAPILEDGVVQINSSETTMKNYYVFDENDKKMELKDCDTLFTDNGYPIVPTTPDANAVSRSLSEKTTFGNKGPYNHKLMEEYLPYGSFITVPRAYGDNALYRVAHELGHSYGLTDVKTATNPKIPVKNPTLINITEYDGYENSSWAAYKNSYGTTETNVLEYIAPGGNQIKYRGTSITCTGGQKYYATAGGFQDYVQGPILLQGETANPVTIQQESENQWECLRYCLDPKLSSNFATQSRKNYWLSTGKCAEKDPKIYFELEEYKKYFELKDLADFFSLSFLKYGISIKELKGYYTLIQFKDAYKINELIKDFTLEELITCHDKESNYCFKADDFRDCLYPDGSDYKKCFDSETLETYLAKYPRK